MNEVSIKLNEEEYDALNSYRCHINDKIKEILKTHISIRRLSNHSRLEDFIFDKLYKTKNYSDFVTLAETYITYTDWCKVNGDITLITKQQFRAGMQDKDMVSSKAGGNRMVFRFVRLKTNEDEEWEL